MNRFVQRRGRTREGILEYRKNSSLECFQRPRELFTRPAELRTPSHTPLGPKRVQGRNAEIVKVRGGSCFQGQSLLRAKVVRGKFVHTAHYCTAGLIAESSAIAESYSAIIRSYKERCLTKMSSAEGVAILATSVDGEPTARPWRSRVSPRPPTPKSDESDEGKHAHDVARVRISSVHARCFAR